MKLKCFINGNEYPLVQGVTFKEEYNETLDSGSIIISGISKMNIQPYDDVFVVSDDEPNYKGGYLRKDEYKSFKMSTVEEIVSSDANFGTPEDISSELSITNDTQNFYINGLNKWIHWFFDFKTDEEGRTKATCKIDLALSCTFIRGDNGREETNNYYIYSENGQAHCQNKYKDNLFGAIGLIYDRKTFLYVYFDYVNLCLVVPKKQIITSINDNQLSITLDDVKIGVYTIARKNINKRYKLYFDKEIMNFIQNTKTSQDSFGEGILNISNNGQVEKFKCNIFKKTDASFSLRVYNSSESGFLLINFELINEKYEALLRTQILQLILKEITYNDSFVLEYFNCSLNEKIYNRSKPLFYKHMLIDNFYEELINIKEGIYKYKIDLMSETKGLEKIPLPNISITLNLNKPEKISTYLKQYVERYSPKIKKIWNEQNDEWRYETKYQISDDLLSIFEEINAPEISLNSPTLRDVLTNLLNTKDMIPVVKDDVIYGLDITKRKGTFQVDNDKINYINSTMTSENYSNSFKKTYTNALSERNYVNSIENIGFRNSNVSTMTVEDIRLELRFPIYKIKKVLLCYYKKIECTVINEQNESTTKNKVFLCKQDITPLILQNVVRNTLTKDWTEFGASAPTSIESLAEFRMATLGYDIGSKYITGWGTKYSYPTGWWTDYTGVYLDEIISLLDSMKPYGDKTYGILDENSLVIASNLGTWEAGIILPDELVSSGDKLKGFFFQVEYQGFYNGTIIHSKDNEDVNENIMVNDNASNSLTILEKDGIMQREKANRTGNRTYYINARYNNLEEMKLLNHELGSVYDDDVIIYSKEIQIWDNQIRANYIGCKNYVLKNYYTSVWAKHRTYNLMSYGESVLRSENCHRYLVFSKTSSFNDVEQDGNNDDILYHNFDDAFFYLLSAFNSSPVLNTNYDYKQKQKINTGLIGVTIEDQLSYHASDINIFTSGYSLCFNVAMYDNNSAGVHIDSTELSAKDKDNNVVGTVQRWDLITEDKFSGAIKDIKFTFCHIVSENVFFDTVEDGNQRVINDIKNFYYPRLFDLPKSSFNFNAVNAYNNVIEYSTNIYKDNKETLDMTLQYEAVVYDEDVFISPLIMQLNDLVAQYNKVSNTYQVVDTIGGSISLIVISFTHKRFFVTDTIGSPAIVMRVKQSDIGSNIVNNKQIRTPFLGPWTYVSVGLIYYIERMEISITKILSIDEIDSNSKPIKFTASLRIKKTTQVSGEQQYERNVQFAKKGTYTDPNNETIYEDFEFRDTEGILTGKFDFDNGYRGAENTSDLNIDNAKFDLSSYFITPTKEISKTYEKNMFIVVSTNELTKSIIYEETPSINLNQSMTIIDKNFNDVFQIETFKYYPAKIKTVLADIEQTNKSISYWFKDEEKGVYRFVFGVNLSEQDFEKGYVEVFVSLLERKSKKVLNYNNEYIAENFNYANNDEKVYGVGNFYEPIIK